MFSFAGMPVITKEPESSLVDEGGTVTLHCVTEGLPKPRVYWVFNGHNVQDDGNIQLTGERFLYG